ncbi:SusC/RagA family TonB-linked outer membrane protein [Halalkalibaculum sp. DA3122]|uniref:SusC/RagA family TonB-linked outer membrane protein n=1 Tax=Halalkalibaculum sp. DA3122 TaxID=3373607 RepID=UPI003753F3CB
MLRKLLSIGVILLASVSISYAQSGDITGVVTDQQSGEPVPGANIFIPNLERGTTTNVDGEYTLNNIPVGTYMVRVSYIGYTTIQQTIDVSTGQNEINFEMQADLIGLEDVVVTAQQIEKERRSLGYSVTSVGGEEINKAKETNFVNSLAGKVPGVSITNQSGNVGGSSRIVIRGIASLSGNNQPLFVVDGIPISNANIVSGTSQDRLTGAIDVGNRASDINPNDVESISVLKGAAAAALYGQRAKNGVIMITTKTGESSGVSVDINSTVRTSNPLRLPDFQNEYAQGDLGKYDVEDLDGWGPRINGQEVEDFRGETVTLQAYPDNVKNFYDSGVTAINSVSVANADEDGDFRLGVTRTDQGGIIPNSNLEKTNLSLNAGSNVSDKITARVGFNYVKTETRGKAVAGGNDPNVLTSLVNTIPRTIANSHMEDYLNEDGSQNALSSFTNNPYWITNENVFTNGIDRVFGYGNIQYDPYEFLNISARVGTDFYTEDRRNINAKGTIGRENGLFTQDVIQNYQFNSDIIVTFQKDLTEDFNLKAIAGHNINTTRLQIQNNEAQELTVDGLYNFANAGSNTPSNEFSERRLIGVYGDVTLGYRDYLFLEVTGRNDWSSTLPKDNNSFFYPSANLSFIFTEGLNLDSDLLSYGKLRLNYAQVGSDEDPYQLDFRYFPVSSFFGQYGTDNTFPFGGQVGFEATGTIPPSDLKPQNQISYEVGAELQFWGGRFGIDFTLYKIDTEDQIISIPIPESTGYSLRRTNIGELSNEGIEVSLNTTPVRGRDVSWNMDVNFTKNNNTVESLAPGVEEIIIESGFNSLQVKAEPGKSLGLYGPGFERDPATGKPVIDPNTGLRREGDIIRLGSVDQDFSVGFNNTFQYKNIGLSFLVDWKQGGTLFSQTVGVLRRDGVVEETLENREGTFIDDGVIVTSRDADGNITGTRPNDVPVQSMEDFWGRYSSSSIHEGNTFPATYVKLREVSVSYNLPRRILQNTPISRASVGLTGRNLFLLYSEIPHIDPETGLFGSASNGQGIEWNNLPSVRSFGANVSISF